MKVLIVDDDEMVRSVCNGMLTLLQHEVVAVNGGEAAIRTLQSSETEFDLILLDALMPGMSGPQTMQQLNYLGGRIQRLGRTSSPYRVGQAVHDSEITIRDRCGISSQCRIHWPLDDRMNSGSDVTWCWSSAGELGLRQQETVSP